MPATGLSLDAAYGDGLSALKLDANNQIMFNNFNDAGVSLTSGHTYKISMRVRTDNVTGPAGSGSYGVVAKFTNWPTVGQTGSFTAITPFVKGDTPWEVVEGTFTATGDFSGPGGCQYLCMILENTTGGTAYVDEITVREDLGGGNYGPNLVFDPKLNSYMEFDPRHGYGMDVVLQEAQSYNMSFKLVIEEKQEYLANHWSPSGLPDIGGGDFNRETGAGRELHGYYWRHLMARYGSYRSVAIWEFVNEEAPGPGAHFRLTSALAQAAAADGNPHLANTSTWGTLAVSAWNDAGSSAIPVADFHCYVRGTGWITPVDTLADDSAPFFHSYDLAAWTSGVNKPWIWGEQGIDGTSGTNGEDPGLANDTNGVWLHKMIWARTGPGGVIPLYWYTDNIFNKNLHGQFGPWKTFMSGIPLNNGHYADAAASLDQHPRPRVGPEGHHRRLVAPVDRQRLQHLVQRGEQPVDAGPVQHGHGEHGLQQHQLHGPYVQHQHRGRHQHSNPDVQRFGCPEPDHLQSGHRHGRADREAVGQYRT